MVDRRVISTSGKVLDEATIQEFKVGLHGELIRPGDEGYEAGRKIWNGMINKHPALIARCTGVADVINAVNFARANKILVAVRGGGHNVAGNAVSDGGIVIDLSRMKGMRVDPNARTQAPRQVWSGGDFNHETQAFGLATTGGISQRQELQGLRSVEVLAGSCASMASHAITFCPWTWSLQKANFWRPVKPIMQIFSGVSGEAEGTLVLPHLLNIDSTQSAQRC